jgi:hypothetical protein
MNYRTSVTTLSAAILFAAVAAPAAAQATMKAVAGSYAAVSVPAFGDKPNGMLILARDGNYALIVRRAQLAPVAAGTRNKGTDAENKALVDGSISHFGKWSIDDGGKAITFHVNQSSFPNWDKKPQKRTLKATGDTLTYVVAAPSTGGAPNDVSWRRIK